MIEIALIVAGIGILAGLAAVLAPDSREGDDWAIRPRV
jgi:hypothetical protein